jgi:hypothetical protein
VREKLRGHELQILQLERINIQADSMDVVIADAWEMVNNIAQGLARQLPGVQFDLKQEYVPSLWAKPHIYFTADSTSRFMFPRPQYARYYRGPECRKAPGDAQHLEALGRGGHWFRRGFLNAKSTGSFARLTQWRWLWSVALSLRKYYPGLRRRNLSIPYTLELSNLSHRTGRRAESYP